MTRCGDDAELRITVESTFHVAQKLAVQNLEVAVHLAHICSRQIRQLTCPHFCTGLARVVPQFGYPLIALPDQVAERKIRPPLSGLLSVRFEGDISEVSRLTNHGVLRLFGE